MRASQREGGAARGVKDGGRVAVTRPRQRPTPSAGDASNTAWRYAEAAGLCMGGVHRGRVDGDSGPNLTSTSMLRVWDTTISALAARRLTSVGAHRCRPSVPAGSRRRQMSLLGPSSRVPASWSRCCPALAVRRAIAGVPRRRVWWRLPSRKNAPTKPVAHGPALLSMR
jgi:hypothetical protein